MENTNEHKPSKLKSLLIFGGLIIGAAVFMSLMKYSASHPVDEKSLATEFVEKQQNNHDAFKQNDVNITKILFDKFPEAQSMLLGNLYIAGNSFKLFVRPTVLSIDSRKAIDTYALDNDGLVIYEVEGDFKNKIASNLKISPWHPELEKKDDTWSWSIESILSKVLNGVFYVLPGMKGLETSVNDLADGLIKLGTEAMPYSVYNKPNDETNTSIIVRATIVNTVRLTKSNLPGSPIVLRSDELGCVFTVWPEYIKEDRFRLEVKDIDCKDADKASKINVIFLFGEDAKNGIAAQVKDGLFEIDEGRELTLVARETK